MLSPRKFYKSIRYALRGLAFVFKNEHSFRVQVLVASIVILAMFYFPLGLWERVALLVLITAVLVLELINSVFERISDSLKPRLSPMVKDMKDIMAGAVFLSAVVSAVIGLIIFWPYLMALYTASF